MPTIKATDAPDRSHCLCLGFHNEAGHSVVDHFWDRSARPRNDGRAARHGLDHHQTERLRPIDRKQQRSRVAEKSLLLSVIYLADELYIVLIEQGFDGLVEVAIFRPRHLGGDAQRQLRGMCHADRDIGTFLGRDPTQKCQIALGGLTELEQLRRKPVMNGGQPVQSGKRSALALGDRDEWASAKRCAVNGKSGKSSRPCNVVRNGVRNRRRSGKCTQSIWEWITSNSPAFSATASSSTAQTAEGSERGRLKRRARGQTGTSLALVRESPLANSVTSWPRPTNSSVNQETTRSVPPYNFGGTLSARGAICA